MQQSHNGACVFDIICNYETTHAYKLSYKCSNNEYLQYYYKCLSLLQCQGGIPVKQQSWKSTGSIADFSHHFLEIQQFLQELIPGIHRSSQITRCQ